MIQMIMMLYLRMKRNSGLYEKNSYNSIDCSCCSYCAVLCIFSYNKIKINIIKRYEEQLNKLFFIPFIKLYIRDFMDLIIINFEASSTSVGKY